MNILWLCSWFPNSRDRYEGDFIERHAQALALYNTVEVIHLVQNPNLLQTAEPAMETYRKGNLTITIYAVPYPNQGWAPLRKLLFNRRYLSRLKAVLSAYISKNGQPDIVHVHVPVKMGAGALWLKKRYNIPFVVTEHTSSYFDHIPDSYAYRNRYFRYITKATFEEAVAVSSVSDWLLQRLQQLFTIGTTQVIRNVVDTTHFFALPHSNTRKRFIHVSMLVPLKNVRGILQALQLLHRQRSDWEMVIVGPADDALQQYAHALGIAGHIRFTGVLHYEQVAPEMQQADALVHFSNYENLPCVVNEALCCGLPVLSSAVGGIPELVHSGNGILVEAGNIAALAGALNHYLDNPAQFDQQRIAAAAQQQFCYATVGKEIQQLYQSVLAK